MDALLQLDLNAVTPTVVLQHATKIASIDTTTLPREHHSMLLVVSQKILQWLLTDRTLLRQCNKRLKKELDDAMTALGKSDVQIVRTQSPPKPNAPTTPTDAMRDATPATPVGTTRNGGELQFMAASTEKKEVLTHTVDDADKKDEVVRRTVARDETLPQTTSALATNETKQLPTCAGRVGTMTSIGPDSVIRGQSVIVCTCASDDSSTPINMDNPSHATTGNMTVERHNAVPDETPSDRCMQEDARRRDSEMMIAPEVQTDADTTSTNGLPMEATCVMDANQRPRLAETDQASVAHQDPTRQPAQLDTTHLRLQNLARGYLARKRFRAMLEAMLDETIHLDI
ncbi:Aste57867_21694 [Aphanomyces stellatus]|uniref:Aste57867_21694 protein n=1 Tax=Aphanomyces stellatus TaxID=120398 RepID=A0A485LN14_9STRA|nr:hypothetical protein As57867_021625 [Aphanomyces stellatus]VFT98363.1 Aste57867_21694 [Aphanomyces stellatus]